MKDVYVIVRDDGTFENVLVGAAATRGAAMRAPIKMLADDLQKEFAHGIYSKYGFTVRADRGRAGWYIWQRTELFE